MGLEERDEKDERRKNALTKTIDEDFIKAQTLIIKEKSPPRKFPKKVPLPVEEEKEMLFKVTEKPKKKDCNCKKGFGLFDILLWVFAFYGSYSLGRTTIAIVSRLFQKGGELPEIPEIPK